MFQKALLVDYNISSRESPIKSFTQYDVAIIAVNCCQTEICELYKFVNYK